LKNKWGKEPHRASYATFGRSYPCSAPFGCSFSVGGEVAPWNWQQEKPEGFQGGPGRGGEEFGRQWEFGEKILDF